MNRKIVLVMTLSLALGLVLAGHLATPTKAASVAPVYIEGNPTCVELGYAYGTKWNYPDDSTGGTYPLGTGSVTWSTDGTYVDWSSTFGIDAVIVKGGSNANLFVYQPPAESFGDTGLVSPTNPKNGQPYGLSHVEFCYDYEVQVTKDALTSYTRTYTWDISKSANPTTLELFRGDSGTSTYSVGVTQHIAESDFFVRGTITITNPDPTFTADITSVLDSAGEVNAPVLCPAMSVPPLASLACTYETFLPTKDQRTNTATVTTTGKVGGGSGTAAITFGEPSTVVGSPTVNVTDTNGSSWQASGTASWQYTRTFACNADEGDQGNIASILETGQSASANVHVNCYALQVTKDAATSFTRTWGWTIAKSSTISSLTLATGEQYLVDYTVAVNAAATDSAFTATGSIWVHNPAPIAAPLISVNDIVSPAVAASVDCGVGFPYSLAPGGTLTCGYTAALPDASMRTNTATATLQNTPGGTTDFSGSANVIFGNPSTEIDECITATDAAHGVLLGQVCAAEAPKTFTYSLTIGPYAACGEYEFINTASFLTNDTNTSSSSSWNVIVTVPCGGCTLTPGYWKTHSGYGPAPYDDAWALLGANEQDTLFFLSGKTYHQVLWTAPGGNAYYILAHAYIAAQLNSLNGASLATVQTQYTKATALFNTYTPAQIAALKGSSALRKQFIDAAAVLDSFNNGLIGPGHCDFNPS